MSEPHLISVIIVTSDRPKQLARALSSVLDQQYRPIEIIIVDNHSVQPPSLPRPPDGVTLRQYRTAARLINSKARNFGVDRSSGELIAFLDDDDYLLEDTLKKRAQAFEDDPSLGVAYAPVNIMDGDGNIVRVLRGVKDHPVMHHIHLNGLLVRRDIVEISRFDERLSRHVDTSFVFRIFKNNRWRILDEPGAVWNHDNRPDQVTHRSLFKKFSNITMRYECARIMTEEFAAELEAMPRLKRNFWRSRAALGLLKGRLLDAIRSAQQVF